MDVIQDTINKISLTFLLITRSGNTCYWLKDQVWRKTLSNIPVFVSVWV